MELPCYHAAWKGGPLSVVETLPHCICMQCAFPLLSHVSCTVISPDSYLILLSKDKLQYNKVHLA